MKARTADTARAADGHTLCLAAEPIPFDAVKRAAKLSPVEYDQQRKAIAKALGIRTTTLDATVAAKRPKCEEAAPPDPPENGCTVAQFNGQPPSLACEPHILRCFSNALAQLGLVGEGRLAELTFLGVVSRLLDRPVSVAVKGPSSGGKSYVVATVLRFFPPSAFLEFTAMSERALVYSKEPLQHRVVILYEAAGLASDFGSYIIRSLLSEGRLRYETVISTKNGLEPRRIEREGPTGLITTTTSIKLHPENETRLISIHVNDSREQTAAIMAAIANEVEPSVDFGPWHTLQHWLVAGEHRVNIPFGQELVAKIKPRAIRLRRDISTMFALIKSHAILHQLSRERDPSGRIVATIDDYAAIHDLVDDLLSAGVEASVTSTVRETVQAAARLCASESETTIAAITRELKLDRSVVSRRVNHAIDQGYMRAIEEGGGRGKPKRVALDEPMPADDPLLPSPQEVRDFGNAAEAALQNCVTVQSEPLGRDSGGFGEDASVRTVEQEEAEAAPTSLSAVTSGGKLCSRCHSLGRVAVVAGDLVCTFCLGGLAHDKLSGRKRA